MLRKPLLALDALAADYLTWSLGDIGKGYARDLREDAIEAMAAYLRARDLPSWQVEELRIGYGESEDDLWWLWDGRGWDEAAGDEQRERTVPQVLTVLAVVVWEGSARPKFEKLHQRELRYVPALGTRTFDKIEAGLLAPGRQVVTSDDGRAGQILDASGRSVALLRPTGGVAAVDPEVLRVLNRDAAVMRSTTFIRLVTCLIGLVCTKKAIDPNAPEPRTIWIEHGYQGLARQAKVARQDDVKRALSIGQRVELQLPSGSLGGLWMFGHQRGYQGCPSLLRVDLQPELVPFGAERQPLVPVLPPDREPALPRDNALRAPALVMVNLLLQHFRLHAPQLRAEGAVPLRQRDVDALLWRLDPSYRARQKVAIMGPLREGDRQRPPLLVHVDEDRVDLHDEYANERAFLCEGGRRSARWRAAGRRGAKRRHGRKTKRR